MSESLQTDPDELFDDAEAPDAPAIRQAATLTVTVPLALAGERADKALAQLLPDHSRSRIQAWIDAGAVTRAGEPVRIRTVVGAGDVLQVTPQPSADSLAFAPEPVPLAVVFEDDAIAVLDKPAGLVVHPAAGNWSGTLLNGLLHRYPDSAQLPRAGIVHRLDKETSGLMVVARTAAAQTELVRQLQARTVKRTYLAVVWGKVAESGTIDRPLGRDPRDRLRIAVVPNGKPARTHFRRLQEGVCAGRPVSLVRCDLDTGRTHQIRVHLESLGHPLLGDPVYQRAVPGEIKAAVPLARQALHATRLGLVHPVSQQPLSWRSPLPEDLARLFVQLGWSDDVALD